MNPEDTRVEAEQLLTEAIEELIDSIGPEPYPDGTGIIRTIGMHYVDALHDALNRWQQSRNAKGES